MICFYKISISNFNSVSTGGNASSSFRKFSPVKSQNTKLNISSRFNYNNTLNMKKKRQIVNLPLDSIILELQSNEVNNDFLKFCFLNRDNISYVLLYQITALKLKSEETENNKTNVNKINNLREKILENIQLIDQPITQSLIVSEKIVKEMLQDENRELNFSQVITNDKINIASIWIVLTAAISAWQNKIRYSKDETPKTTLKKLVDLKKMIFKEERFYSFLSKELSLLDSYDFLSNTIEPVEIDVGLLDGIKLLICILEKLPKSSYGVLLDDVSIFYNNLLKTKLGLTKQSLTDNIIQFSPKKINTDSRLVNIKEKNFKN
mmetsp:Transcript_28752/g.42254  ORF Transcript_28752/g.42254 Transcript_28752/m.42254 type:complete len:321 (-) Transcript_28752:543-1505(-)